MPIEGPPAGGAWGRTAIKVHNNIEKRAADEEKQKAEKVAAAMFKKEAEKKTKQESEKK
jgi:hypothetical protein